MEIPVKLLPDQPERVAVQWDAQQASIAAAGGDMAAVTSGLQATYGSAADAAMRQAQANAAAEDPATKIEKLGQMRDSGLITPEEFEDEEEGDPELDVGAVRRRSSAQSDRRARRPARRARRASAGAPCRPSSRACPAPSSSKRAVSRKTLVMNPLKSSAKPSVQTTRIFCGQSM